MTTFDHPRVDRTIALLTDAGLPSDDVAALDFAHFLGIGDPDHPDGVVGLEVFGDVALLRSLVLRPDRRGTGEGRLLVDAVEAHARTHGITRLYLLTSTAEAFFAHLGYARTARETAPDSIRTTREFASLCPSTAAFMVKTLA